VNDFNLVKNIYKMPLPNDITNDKRLTALPFRLRIKVSIHILLLTSNINTRNSTQCNETRKVKSIQKGKEELKLSSFA
jgi:hypothetical protein